MFKTARVGAFEGPGDCGWSHQKVRQHLLAQVLIQAPASCRLKGICGGRLPHALAWLVEGERHMFLWMLLMGTGRREAWGALKLPFDSLAKQDHFVIQGVKTAIPAGVAVHAAAKARAISTNSIEPPSTHGSHIKTQQVFPRSQGQSRSVAAGGSVIPPLSKVWAFQGGCPHWAARGR